MHDSSALSIAIVIPVYNGGQKFQKCLTSIQNSCYTPDELIVVSDCDTDGSWQLAKDFGAQVHRLTSQVGPAKARNIGVEKASSDIIFFIDADVEVHNDTIGKVVQEFQKRPQMDALIGSYDDEPYETNFLSQYKNLFNHYVHQTALEEASTFWGACGAIRKSVFLTAGGFDESYRKPCIEDIELGYRLKQRGYQIRLCKDIQVKHLKCWQPLSLLRAEIFYRALPWTELLLSQKQFNADLNLSYSNRLSVLLVFGLGATGIGSIYWPNLLFLGGLTAVALFIINARVYRFFYQKRGLAFALKTIPWHWFYFLYGGFSFALATLSFQLRRIQDTDRRVTQY